MSRDVSNSPAAERDLLCRGLSGFLLGCVPWIVFALGFGASPWLRTILWTASFALMATACLLNAARCGRVHCRFTGPFFSSFAPLFHSAMVSDFCRSARLRGSGLALGRSLALWPFVAFQNCFSVGIAEKLSIASSLLHLIFSE